MKAPRISLALKALRQLSPRQLGLYVLYRLGLKSGVFRWLAEDRGRKTEYPGLRPPILRHLLDLPDPTTLRDIIGPEGMAQLKAEADEIMEGRIRLFGGRPVPLNLIPPGESAHWTEYKSASIRAHPRPIDIKFIWEPARFGWAFTLGRAYHLTGDERYPEAFWRYFETFQQTNPPYRGPNWASAQEAALRILAFAFAGQVFAHSVHSLATRNAQLATSIAAHAGRIPPTLIYARAQNNNHLLSEAAGLITAALALPDHPQAKRWHQLGWKWFSWGLAHQITKDGSYVQHSTNYHRLMLQLALWVWGVSGIGDQGSGSRYQVAGEEGQGFGGSGSLDQPSLISNLQRATRWLLALTDPMSGRLPNLGPNDGAYILPLAALLFDDYRPVLQAASCAFLGQPTYEPGTWDEMGIWLQVPGTSPQANPKPPKFTPPPTLPPPSTLHALHSWAYLRAARFEDRPGHADQLHLDLWWRGLNVARDAGTYLYNAEPPWDNALAHSAVHNTVIVDGCEQMTRAGRFLYLDWAQAEMVTRETASDGSWERIAARQNGYLRLGVIHQRTITAFADDRWIIEDQLLSAHGLPLTPHHAIRLHWLLPDWDYELQPAECGVRIRSPQGWISLLVSGQPSALGIQFVRAGELLHGLGEISPTWGWFSPTYGVREPALSFAVTVTGNLPVILVSQWKFPEAR